MTMRRCQLVENVEGEAVKRLSCEVKGQIDACERSARGAGSPLSQMPSLEQKAGYDQHTSPAVSDLEEVTGQRKMFTPFD